MESHRREMYRETTGWAPWVYALLWGVMGASALLVLFGPGASGSGSDPERIWGAAVTIGVMGMIQLLFGGLTVVVRPDGIRVGLGKGWPLRTWIPFQEVEGVESVTYSPMKEFGGWGLRGSRKKRAWTARGNKAVVLSLADGRRIYIGSDDPSRLESRIRMAMATARPR